jgi:hypothetical protein
MGDRNFLHVCPHCGNVMAASSLTGPRECFNCEGETVSGYTRVMEHPV